VPLAPFGTAVDTDALFSGRLAASPPEPQAEQRAPLDAASSEAEDKKARRVSKAERRADGHKSGESRGTGTGRRART
jgi:hypothetical protein